LNISAPPQPQISASHIYAEDRPSLPALTGVRFFAAFYVVLFHVLPFLKARYPLPMPVQILLSNGSLAVGFFFLLSGFILGYTYEGHIQGSADRVRFWQARFARIYPVYLLSLLLSYWFQRGLGPGSALAVIFMVQAWNPFRPDLAGAWNYPAWTLSAEAFFYVSFPFIMGWFSRRNTQFLRLVIFLLFLTCVFAHTIVQVLGNVDHTTLAGRLLPLPLMRLPEFLLGVALSLLFLRAKNPRSHPIRTYGGAIVTIFLLSLPIGHWVSLVIIPFAVLTYDLALGSSILAKLLSTPMMTLLGGASYAIYLLQYPVRGWTRMLFSSGSPSAQTLGQILTPVILVVFSIFVFRYFEQPARRALRRWFGAVNNRLMRLRLSRVAVRGN
jgi:peptidoglycan/LPS O-acetylase OafA/YrhL